MVPVRFQQNAVSGLRPCAELFVDLRQHGAALGVLAGLHQILVIIQHQNRRHRAAGLVNILQAVGLRGFHPIGCRHHALCAALAPGAHQTAVHPEAAVVHGHPLRAFLLAAEKPLGLELRHSLGKPHFKQMLPDAG